MTAPAPEKAAPIPAEVRKLAEASLPSWYLTGYHVTHDAWVNAIAAAILADREARPSLPDSREERIREDERAEFNRGYLIAVANVMNMHKDAVIAVELLVQLGVTIDEAEGLDLTEYDMDALKRLRSEPRAAPFFKRKRRARARQGGNNG